MAIDENTWSMNEAQFLFGYPKIPLAACRPALWRGSPRHCGTLRSAAPPLLLNRSAKTGGVAAKKVGGTLGVAEPHRSAMRQAVKNKGIVRPGQSLTIRYGYRF